MPYITMKMLRNYPISLLLLFTFFLLQLPSSVSAQRKLNVSVKSFTLDPFDGTASNPDYRLSDASGNLYAIIKVRPGASEFDFNFGALKCIVDPVDHDDETWIYVQKHAKTVTIKRDGYKTIKNYDLGMTIEAGKTYIMELTSDQITTIVKAELNMQMLEFRLSPVVNGAMVMIKNADATEYEIFGSIDVTGSVSKNMPFGEYDYQVLATNYNTTEGRVNLISSDSTYIEKVTLKSNFSQITLNAGSDANIYINKEYKGRRIWTVALKAGENVVECRQENHRSTSRRILVRANYNETIELQQPIPITGNLALRSNPAGASIAIDGKPYNGRTPCNIKDLLIGRHTITVSKPQYAPATKVVEIKEGEITNAHVTLSNIGNVKIECDPYGTLYVDGKHVGYTPQTISVASGYYNIELRNYSRKYKNIKKRVYIDTSKGTYNFKMKRMYQYRNYFYVQGAMQFGSLPAFGGGIGFFAGNFNMQADYMIGTKESNAYWNEVNPTTGQMSEPLEFSYEPTFIGGRVGYGFIFGSRFRFTPQAGGGVVSIAGKYDYADEQTSFSMEMDGYAAVMTFGMRMDFAFASWIGLTVTPELWVPLKKSDTFDVLSEVSKDIKGWASGFNCRCGLYIGF